MLIDWRLRALLRSPNHVLNTWAKGRNILSEVKEIYVSDLASPVSKYDQNWHPATKTLLVRENLQSTRILT